MCDSFAGSGFATYACDYLNDDAIPLDGLNNPAFDRAGWFARHDLDVTRPVIDTLMAALRDQGVTKFCATGYCFGGRYIKELCIDNVLVAGATAHPARIDVPVDLEALLAKSKTPLLINACEVDQTVSVSLEERLYASLTDIAAVIRSGRRSTRTRPRRCLAEASIQVGSRIIMRLV